MLDALADDFAACQKRDRKQCARHAPNPAQENDGDEDRHRVEQKPPLDDNWHREVTQLIKIMYAAGAMSALPSVSKLTIDMIKSVNVMAISPT